MTNTFYSSIEPWTVENQRGNDAIEMSELPSKMDRPIKQDRDSKP